MIMPKWEIGDVVTYKVKDSNLENYAYVTGIKVNTDTSSKSKYTYMINETKNSKETFEIIEELITGVLCKDWIERMYKFRIHDMNEDIKEMKENVKKWYNKKMEDLNRYEITKGTR